MYEKIQSEIKEDYYQTNYSNDGQRFIAWYLRNIHLRDENEAKADITDGQNDKQIDAIFIDDNNNTAFIVQGKFVGKNSVDAEPLREVLSSWLYLKEPEKLQENSSSKLKQKLPELCQAIDDDYDIEFELITTSALTKEAKKDFDLFNEKIIEDQDFSASVKIVDNEALEDRYNLALDKENPFINHTINLENNKFLRMNMDGTNIIITALPLKECARLPGIKDGTLFKKNVRQSLGLNNRVNKGIKETISKESSDFFFFHNGVTALCSNMNLEGNILKVKALSVVNGCQSLNTILSCSGKSKKPR